VQETTSGILRITTLALTEGNKPEGVKPNVRERRGRSVVHRQGALKQKGVKGGVGVVDFFSSPKPTLKQATAAFFQSSHSEI
jgi:hypothetical protein